MAKSPTTLDGTKGHHGKIVKYYRSVVKNPPDGWTQEQLAEAMNVSVRWVQEIESMAFVHSTDRRKALVGVLGIPPALLNLEEPEKLSGNAPLSIWIIDSLEHETRSRWQLYYTSSNTVTEKGLFDQIEKLEQLADSNSKYHDRIFRILAQDYQLAGSLARDNFHYSNAKKYFRELQRLAGEAKSVDLAAVAVERQAAVLLRQERVEEALKLYQEGAELAIHAEPYVRAYVQVGLAEALARNAQRDECYRALDQAQKLLDRSRTIPIEEDVTHVCLTAQSLESTWGECHVLLGEPRKGLDYLRTALRKLDPTMSRRRCCLLIQQAEAHLAADRPDDCVRYTLKGLQLAQALNSKENTHWAREIHTKLLQSKWKHEPVVAQLGLAIVS